MFHAYQKSENNKLYQKGLSFNYEFEAKMVKLFILLELEQPHLPGTSQNMPILDKIEKYTDIGKKMPSSSLLDNPFIQNLYIKEANKYSELNRKTDYGNSNYKVSTHQKPVSLLRLFRDAGY